MSEGRESANFFKRSGENDRHEARAIVWGSNKQHFSRNHEDALIHIGNVRASVPGRITALSPA